MQSIGQSENEVDNDTDSESEESENEEIVDLNALQGNSRGMNRSRLENNLQRFTDSKNKDTPFVKSSTFREKRWI